MVLAKEWTDERAEHFEQFQSLNSVDTLPYCTRQHENSKFTAKLNTYWPWCALDADKKDIMSFPVRLLFKGSTSTTIPLRRYFSNRKRRPFRSDLAGSGRLRRQKQQRDNQEADPFSPAAIRHNRNQNMDSGSDNILFSNSSVRWATFLVLGIVPLVIFGIVVNSTPHLRMQLKETINSVQSYASGRESSEENPTNTKPEEIEAINKSDT